MVVVRISELALLPKAVLAETPISASFDPSTLLPEERSIFDALSTPRRRAEWLAGRAAARAALAALGASGLAVGADPRGAPILIGPRAEAFSVAITHGEEDAAAIASPLAAPWPHVGLDWVDARDAARIQRLEGRVFHPGETAPRRDDLARRVGWGAKEALAKATSTGMFAFGLSAVRILEIEPGGLVRTNLSGASVGFEPRADAVLVFAGVTGECRDWAKGFLEG
jgi:enterobactin synthetase component D